MLIRLENRIDLFWNLLEECTAVLARLPIREVPLMESKD